MFSSIAQRAWFAWHCLPRNEKGQPPSINHLERDHDLSHAQLRKLIMGKAPRPGYTTIVKAARALDCDPGWLGRNEGPRPVTSWLVPPGPPPQKAKQLAAPAPRALGEREILIFESKASELSQRARPVTRKRAR
jgi:hypothetical protein